MSIAKRLAGALARRTEQERDAVILAVTAWAVYMADLVLGHVLKFGPVQSPNNHFVLLADAFLHGRLGLTPEQAANLMEVVPYQGHYYIAYPPTPAVLFVPIVAVFGTTVHINVVSITTAACAVGAAYVMLRRMGFARVVSIWTTILFSFGTNFWYTSLNGSPWYFAHIVCCLFFALALCELYGAQRTWLVGLLLGAAVLARLPVAIAIPVVLLACVLIPTKLDRVRSALGFLVGVAIPLGVYVLYNRARFGTIFNVAYTLMPGELAEPWNKRGILDLSYLPRNLYALFLQPPVLIDRFPYFVPSTFGLGLFATTPAFLMMFRAPANRFLTWLAIAGALAAMAPDLLHGWPGGTQYGYRFALDAAPLLLALVALGLGESVSTRAKVLIGLSISLSVWGLVYARWIPVQWLFPLPDLS